LIENGYVELSISGEHAIAVDALPRLHKDPFDRMLVAQSMVESVTLLTTDARLAAYPAPVRRV
jgi:PIN domain nuclease of toxin-antitoxin system